VCATALLTVKHYGGYGTDFLFKCHSRRMLETFSVNQIHLSALHAVRLSIVELSKKKENGDERTAKSRLTQLAYIT
jgi:hypothetical protein